MINLCFYIHVCNLYVSNKIGDYCQYFIVENELILRNIKCNY